MRGTERVFVVEAVRSVLATADAPVEVIVVAGRETPNATITQLEALAPAGQVRCVAFDAPFNFSATVNLGASHARGPQLLLLNDDTEVIGADWLVRMLDAAASGDRVGAVGARLLFEDGTLQHGGHTYRTSLDHIGFGLPGDFCSGFPGNYNDVDYCLKLRAAGYHIVYEPDAVLWHFESRSRVAGIRPDEIELIQRRWLTELIDDPFTPVVV
ncbi:MAG: glycosyl transferase family 2 protein [Acidimicrobiaceae bacterium]|nr:MAG: glycosyl transferase family 2 protein [Acidimicrobiaceae bacterium]